MTDKKENKKIVKAMDEDDIKIFKRFGIGPCAQQIKEIEEENKKLVGEIKNTIGVKESDTGLALPS